MKVFLAISNEYFLRFVDPNSFYGLFSYHYSKKNEKLSSYSTKFNDFILDSGIFTYLNGKDARNVDWEKYIHEYGNYVKENRIKNYVEVDIDKIVGLAEVERLRKKLEKIVGWQTIPVWHMNRGYDKWLEIVKDYNYVCFGAFITDGLSKDKYKFIPKFIQDANKQSCKVHGLGMTDFEWLKKLKFYSVDSSSWCIGVRYGSIAKFTGDRIKVLKKPDGMKFTDYKDVGVHNLKEWIKFVNYAKYNL